MKSHASCFLELATLIYKDVIAKCTDVLLDQRDVRTITSRFKHEGMSFLTITLPDLGRDFDRSLSAGYIDATAFLSFKKRANIPVFLQGLFRQVFDEGGILYEDPNHMAIKGIRQIAYTFKKVKISCAPIRIKGAMVKFLESELEFEEPLQREDIINFLDVSKRVWAELLYNNKNLIIRNTLPKHGPGATAERLSGNAKYLSARWHDRLEPYFPVLDTGFANARSRHSAEFELVTIVNEDDEQPVRVITVPKTLKSPRIIAIEPVCMQYVQQAIMNPLVKELERFRLTAGHLNYTDQSINQVLALSSSIDGRYATIDMSSASDLVPYELAIRMFDSNPDLKDAISACRSRRAELPSGEVINLKKFASMGSALCFPIESMYFYTICVMALLKKRKLPCTSPAVMQVAKDVYIYGDDIIIPTDESEVVMETLQKYYCKVNTDKSFTRGLFRESCGMDAFQGTPVTPVYVREVCPQSKREASKLISWVETSTLLFEAGYVQSSSYMYQHVEQFLGKLPRVSGTCAGLCRPSTNNWLSTSILGKTKLRWNRRLHRLEVKAWVPTPVYRKDQLHGCKALLKCLLKLERAEYIDPHDGIDLSDVIINDEEHLTRTARHGAVTLKSRWTPA